MGIGALRACLIAGAVAWVWLFLWLQAEVANRYGDDPWSFLGRLALTLIAVLPVRLIGRAEETPQAANRDDDGAPLAVRSRAGVMTATMACWLVVLPPLTWFVVAREVGGPGSMALVGGAVLVAMAFSFAPVVVGVRSSGVTDSAAARLPSLGRLLWGTAVRACLGGVALWLGADPDVSSEARLGLVLVAVGWWATCGWRFAVTLERRRALALERGEPLNRGA